MSNPDCTHCTCQCSYRHFHPYCLAQSCQTSPWCADHLRHHPVQLRSKLPLTSGDIQPGSRNVCILPGACSSLSSSSARYRSPCCSGVQGLQPSRPIRPVMYLRSQQRRLSRTNAGISLLIMLVSCLVAGQACNGTVTVGVDYNSFGGAYGATAAQRYVCPGEIGNTDQCVESISPCCTAGCQHL